MENLRYERVPNAGFGRNCSFEDADLKEFFLMKRSPEHPVRMRSILRTLLERWDQYFRDSHIVGRLGVFVLKASALACRSGRRCFLN